MRILGCDTNKNLSHITNQFIMYGLMLIQMINDDDLYFELKECGDFVRIDSIRFSHPNPQLDWDKKWIRSFVTLKAGGFLGQFECDLMIDDLVEFKHQLSILYERHEGTALLDTLEGQLKINIKGDGIGHFEAKCYAMDFAGTGNKLDFEINFDQTILPNMVKQLEKIIKYFSERTKEESI